MGTGELIVVSSRRPTHAAASVSAPISGWYRVWQNGRGGLAFNLNIISNGLHVLADSFQYVGNNFQTSRVQIQLTGD